jgi:hypothetical protein
MILLSITHSWSYGEIKQLSDRVYMPKLHPDSIREWRSRFNFSDLQSQSEEGCHVNIKQASPVSRSEKITVTLKLTRNLPC